MEQLPLIVLQSIWTMVGNFWLRIGRHKHSPNESQQSDYPLADRLHRHFDLFRFVYWEKGDVFQWTLQFDCTLYLPWQFGPSGMANRYSWIAVTLNPNASIIALTEEIVRVQSVENDSSAFDITIHAVASPFFRPPIRSTAMIDYASRYWSKKGLNELLFNADGNTNLVEFVELQDWR